MATSMRVCASVFGKVRRIPCHHRPRQYIQDYIETAGFTDPRDTAPLFQSSRRRTGTLTGHAIHRRDAWRMIKRRCAAVGLPPSICNHSFRGTGITIFFERGGVLETAQQIAGHADIRVTRLYDRRSRTIQRAEVERVQLKPPLVGKGRDGIRRQSEHRGQ